MKIYISADMEGVSGIVHTAHTNPRGFDYEPARRWMMAEVNAAVAGAFEGGATEAVVSDSHGGNGNRNLILADLDTRAELITGRPRPLGQLEGLDDTYGAVLLIGYHARHGSAGVLSHTTNGRSIANLWVNDVLVGEIGLNAYLAGHFGVPVAMVSGDDLTVAEAKALLPSVEGAVVKWALGRFSAQCMHPTRAQEVVRQAAKRAVQRAPSMSPLAFDGPITVTVQFKDTGGAESAQRIPDVDMIADDTLRVQRPDMVSAYETYSSIVGLWPIVWGAWERG